MKKLDDEAKRVCIYLDDKTIEILKEYGLIKFGSKNMSQNIRSIAREIESKMLEPSKTVLSN